MGGITAVVTDNAKLGYYRIYAQAPGSDQKTEITFFRGAPVSIGSISHADPFGDKSATITVPNVTIYDTLGSGDLEWLAAWSKIDIVWEPDSELDSVTAQLMEEWSWEGNIASWSFKQDSTNGSITIDCVGSLYILDNLLAMPFYPTRPVPFEVLIERVFKKASDYNYGLGNLIIDYDPDECMTYYKANYKFAIQNPVYLQEGQLWSGFATRSSGDRSPSLTGFISSLLSQMYSSTGKQWTLMNKKDRMSVLKVRKYRDESYINNNKTDYDVLYIDAVTPGVTINLNQDYSQTANVVYGTGTTIDGRKFSSPSGNVVKRPQISNTTLDYLYYEQNPQPFAIQDIIADVNNPSHKKTVRKELSIDFQPGVNALQALDVAKRQLDVAKDPGYSGTITISVDTKTGSGFVFPRYLLKAGKTIVVYFGDTDHKAIFNISECSLNIETGEATLTVDTKFRDLITVEEVRARRGDALNMVRRLSTALVGADIPQADYLRPWHGTKSGKLPKTQQSLELFDEIDFSGSVFPWTDVTTKYPPKSYPDAYVKIGPTKTKKPDGNWVGPIKVLLSAKGNIGLTQICAYDDNGNVLPVEFHASFYLSKNVSNKTMPMIWNRTQDFTRNVSSARWVTRKSEEPGYTGTEGWVEITFSKPHTLQTGSKGWEVGATTTLSGNWAPTVGNSISIEGPKTIRYLKSSKPSGASPTSGTLAMVKQTFPRQRASLGANSTNITANYSKYSVEWNPNVSKYKVSIFVGDEASVKIQAAIEAAVKSKSIKDDFMYGNANSNITVSGSSINPSINGSFTTIESSEPGTIQYYINATDVTSGTYEEDGIVVELDIATSGEDPGNYPTGGHYPFYEWAFQSGFSDGTPFTETQDISVLQHARGDSSFIMGWGNYWQPAGYGSGLASQGDPKTGTLIDESGWSYDTTASLANTWQGDESVPSTLSNDDNLGYVYAMIYCDDQGADNVWFLGRMWPGGEQI